MSAKNTLLPLVDYVVPSWAAKLRVQPKHFVKLASKNTPIERWLFNEVPKNFDLYIKRDDLTGNMLSGNKVRKLELFFADALTKKSTCIITCGGLQSNHCRATAVVAKQLNLNCHLLHRSRKQEDVKLCSGNMLINRLYNAQCYTVPYESLANGLSARIDKLAHSLLEKGEKPYIIPLGGSNTLGTFGVIDLFAELLEQDVTLRFDDIVVATGSGGTLAGLAIANYLTGEKLRVHGVCVSDCGEYFYNHINNMLSAYGLYETQSHEICDIIDGYKGGGYAITTPEDLELLISISQQTGIILDYTYTLKAVKGMLTEMVKNPSRFKGNRVLFVHTGGVFSIFDGVINETLLKKTTIHEWGEEFH